MAPEPRPLRLAHTSDVHLGAHAASPRGRREPGNRRLEAGFRAVVDLARERAADVLLIAGDFFDHARVGAELAAFAAAQCNRFPGVTVLLPGNHDPIGAHGPHERHDLERMAPRLRLIRDPEGEFIDLPALDLAVWGRAITVNVTERPLAAPPPRRRERAWNVAMAHGHAVAEDTQRERSLRITPEHLAESAQWDYVALGHWDVHADVSAAGALAVYSGSPAALGDAGYGVAVIVDLDANGARWRAESLSPEFAP